MSSSSSKLNALIELQRVLNRTDALRREMDDLPKKLEAVEHEKQARKDALERERETLKEHRIKLKKVEIDLATAEEHLNKKRTQIHTIKTNKEYTAMQHEITALEHNISTCEEAILVLMDKIEQESQRLKAHEVEVQNDIQSLDRRGVELQQISEVKAAELEQTEQLSQTARQAVHPGLITQFDRLYIRNKGVALASVADNNCGYCSVSLTPQTLAQVADGWDIIRCERCSCILYMEAQPPVDGAAVAAKE